VQWAGEDAFDLVHMGTFHGVDAREGLTRNGFAKVRHRQIDPLGRSGYYLLHAMARLRQGAPEAWSRLRVHLYGNVDNSHRALIERLGLGESVVTHGYVPHRESIAALCSSDAVFVPLHGVPAGERALVVPGKLYEALASRRPILAALPAGDGADLVRQLDAGLVVPPTDAACLGEALQTMIEARERGEAVPGCPRARLAGFDRRYLTRLLAEVCDAAAGGRSSVSFDSPFPALARGG